MIAPLFYLLASFAFAAAAYVIDAFYTITRKDFRKREITNMAVRKYGAKGFLFTLPLFALVAGLAFANLINNIEFTLDVAAVQFSIMGSWWTFAFLKNYRLEQKEKASLR